MIRKSQIVKSLILTACFLAVAITLEAEQETDPMHPAFKLLDARGEVIQQEERNPIRSEPAANAIQRLLFPSTICRRISKEK